MTSDGEDRTTPRPMPQPNLWPLPTADEALLREHHATDQGWERCVICRLLATIDALREACP